MHISCLEKSMYLNYSIFVFNIQLYSGVLIMFSKVALSHEKYSISYEDSISKYLVVFWNTRINYEIQLMNPKKQFHEICFSRMQHFLFKIHILIICLFRISVHNIDVCPIFRIFLLNLLNFNRFQEIFSDELDVFACELYDDCC